MRPDGRPHVTPLNSVWFEHAAYFCTGPTERKAKNLATNASCILTTGTNAFDHGLDVVLEADATRVRDAGQLWQHRGMLIRRWTIAAMAIMAVSVVGGCGTDDPTSAPQSTTAPSGGQSSSPSASQSADQSASQPPAAPTDLDGCITAEDATLLVHQGESTVADVAIMGDGQVGVVISYETSRYVCTWLPLAERLVEAGYRVLLYDTVSGTAIDHVVDRAALLRDEGVTDVVLVGGSLGGAASIVAAAEIEPPVAAVVSLSGGGIDTTDAAPEITSPMLQVVAEEDSPFAAVANQNDVAATGSPAHELVRLPGRTHASTFFTSPDAEVVLSTVVEFIQEHAPAT